MRVLIGCPDLSTPRGGVRKLYLHADVLNEAGISSFIVHERRGFFCDWFTHNTRITYTDDLELKDDDVLVLPEVWSQFVDSYAPGIRKVIINLNGYNTLKYFNPSSMPNPYFNKDVIGVMVNSQHDQAYLKYLFPHISPHLIVNGIDPVLFKYTSGKKFQACYLPGKNPDAANHFSRFLYCRGISDRLKLISIEATQFEVYASILRESLFFVSFSYNEGFGLPPAEAMSAGCVTLGFHGNGGKEFLKAPYGFPIETNDVLAMAITMEHLLNRFEEDPESISLLRQESSNFIQQNYSLEREKESILAFWKSIV